MQKKLCLALSMTLLCCWSESSPVDLGSLEFDNLDSDLSDLKYEVEEEDLDDFSKLLDDADEAAKENTAAKTNVKTTGFKKKKTSNKGLKSKHNIKNLKKFYNLAGASDDKSYGDDDVYGEVDGLAAQAVGITGNEKRKYRKGTKTRGFHRVHHKDEYKKDKEFYEDDETGGAVNKVGAKVLGYKVGAGASFNKGHVRHKVSKGIYGKRGFSDRGLADKEFDGYDDSQGFDGSFANDS